MKVWTTMLLLTGLLAGFFVASKPQPHVRAAGFHTSVMTLPPQWDLKAIGVGKAWKLLGTGQHATVCDVDTGASPMPDLAGAIIGGVNTVDPLQSTNFTDDAGHGSFTATEMVGRGFQITGVAPTASLYAAKVLDNTGDGGYDAVDSGILACIKAHASVINLSLGGTASGYDGAHEAVRAACRSNIALAFAAGNDSAAGEGTNPAGVRSPCSITVGAVDRHRVFASFSNWMSRDFPNYVVAPGENIVGDSSTGLLTIMSGTSMSTPLVTGCLALLVSAGASARQAVSDILATAAQPPSVKAGGYVRSFYGRGELNCGAAAARMKAGL